MADTFAYPKLVHGQIRAEVQYRASFVAFLLAQTILFGTDAVAVWAVFTKVSSLGHWNVRQVLFLYGITTCAFGVADIFVSPVENASIHIQAGSLDRLYVRPMGILTQLLAQEFALRRVGKLLQATIVLIVGISLTSVHWTPARVAMVPFAIACGAITYSSLFVLTSSLSFWLVSTQEIANSVTYGGVTMSQFPVHIYGAWLRRTVLTVIPIASVAYLPGLYILQAANPLRIATWAQILSPLLCVPAALVAAFVWRRATRHYQSTGS